MRQFSEGFIYFLAALMVATFFIAVLMGEGDKGLIDLF